MPLDADSLQAISSILSVIIAVVALYTAIRSEQRANKQFQENIRLQQEVIELSHKPLLQITFHHSLNSQGVAIHNVGNGTAVITKTRFDIDERSHFTLQNVLRFPDEGVDIYEKGFYFSDSRPSYLEAGKILEIVSVSRAMYENLRKGIEDGVYDLSDTPISDDFVLDDNYIESVLETIAKQLERVKIQIDYEDILGNKQTSSVIDASSRQNR
ncbi:MAG: hypothetical protein AAF846_23870 [Chloroflexota bacterium]